MATRLQATYYSKKESSTFVISLDDTDHASGTTDFEATDLTFTWTGETEERFNPVMTSTMSLGIVVNSNGIKNFTEDLVGAQEERFTVKVTKGGNLYWVGFVLVDLVTMEDKPYPRVFTLKATDGIGRLKDVDYNNNGTAYTGKATVMAHLFNVLGKTNALQDYWAAGDIYLDSVIDWWENSQTIAAATDPLTVTRFDHRAFITIDEQGVKTYNSAFEVLEMICQQWGARFMHTDGRYKLIQVNEYADTGTVTIRHFVKAGTYDSNTTTTSFALYDKTWGNPGEYPGSADFLGLVGGNFQHYPALDRVTVFYDHFSTRNIATNAFVWDEATTTEQTAADIDDNGGTARLAFRGSMSFKVNMLTFQPVRLKLKMRLKIDDGATINYLKRTATISSNGQVSYSAQSWTTTESFYEFVTHQISINNITFYETLPQDISPALPQDGDLGIKIQFGNAYNSTGQVVTGTNHTYDVNNFYLEVLLDGTPEGQYNRTKYEATNTDSADNTAKVEYILLTGDGPTGNAFGHLEVYDGAGWSNSGETWRKGSTGSYDKSINELLAFEVISGQITPVKKWQGQLVGDLEVFSTLVRDSENYICSGARYDAGRDIWDGQWFVISTNPTPINVEDSEAQIGTEVNPGPPSRPPVPPTENPGVVDTGLAAPTYPDIYAAESEVAISSGDNVTDIDVGETNEDEIFLDDDSVVIMNPGTGENQLAQIDGEPGHTTDTFGIQETTANYDYPEGSYVIPDPIERQADIVWGRRKFFRFQLYGYSENFTTSATYVTLEPFFRPHKQSGAATLQYDLAELKYIRNIYWEVGQPEGTSTPQYTLRVYDATNALTVGNTVNLAGTESKEAVIPQSYILLENAVYVFQIKRTDGGSATHSKGLNCILEIINKHFSPSDIDGLTVWLRADAQVYNDAGTTRATDGQTVQEWHDQSGNNNDATQTTAANKPTLALNAVNGWPAILFDGTNDRFDIGAVSDFVFLHDTGGTVFIVFQPGTAADPDDIYALISNSTTTTDVGFNISYDDQTATPANDQIITTVYNGTLGQTVVSNSQNNVTPANEFSLITVVLDPDNGTTANRGYIYAKDETITAQNNAATDSSSSANATRVAQIGSNGVGGDPLDGYIAEILMYDTVLAATDRQKVLRYLNRKYSFSYYFLPSDVSGLVLWLDANEGVTEAGTGVSTWADQSGNANDATQGTDANRPSLVTDAINGQAVIRFNGSSDNLTNSTLSESQVNTVFVVAKAGGNTQVFFDGNDTASTRQLIDRDGAGAWRVRAGTSLTGGTADTNYHIFRAVFNGVSSALYVDGASVLSGDAGSDSIVGYTLGANFLQSGNFLNGDISEVLFYNQSLAANEISSIESYLASKYNITI